MPRSTQGPKPPRVFYKTVTNLLESPSLPLKILPLMSWSRSRLTRWAKPDLILLRLCRTRMRRQNWTNSKILSPISKDLSSSMVNIPESGQLLRRSLWVTQVWTSKNTVLWRTSSMISKETRFSMVGRCLPTENNSKTFDLTTYPLKSSFQKTI